MLLSLALRIFFQKNCNASCLSEIEVYLWQFLHFLDEACQILVGDLYIFLIIEKEKQSTFVNQLKVKREKKSVHALVKS